VHHKAIQVFLGINKFAAIPFLEGDIGWVPTIIRQKIRMLRFWNRLLKLEPSRLTKKIFLLEYEKKGSWCKEIENILKGIHLEAYYINNSLVNLEECQTKLMSNFEQAWIKSLDKKPKLRLFKKWKHDLKVPPYIKLNLTRQQRSFLAQVRSGSLPIHIETGRYVGLAIELRTCKFCTNEEVETEYHFLFQCNCYSLTRNLFFLENGPEPVELEYDEYICYLFSEAPRALATFINKIYHERRDIEYPTL